MLDCKKGLTVNFHHGSLTKLNLSWHDKNVICPNSKIYYVTDGEICVTTDKGEFIARRADAILIPEGIKHSYNLTESGYAEKYWFHFDLKIDNADYFNSVRIPFIKHLGCSRELISLFDRVVSADSNALTVSSAILEIISLYTQGEEVLEAPLGKRDETDRIIAKIRENYSENYDLDTLAKEAGLSKNHFAKKFKEKTGDSPHKYINSLKLERAKFLLEYTDKSIGEIMDEVGFFDSAHFSKIFRQFTGYSPSMFRSVITTVRKA